MTTHEIPQSADITCFEGIRDYEWDEDAEFQTGLRHILASAPPQKTEELTLRAKCFFYKRKTGINIDFEAFREWSGFPTQASPPPTVPSGTVHTGTESSTSKPLDTTDPQLGTDTFPSVEVSQSPAPGEADVSAGGRSGGSDDAPYPKSFQEIVELITTGKPIPGIKEIPDKVNDAPPSQSARPERKKPWEVAAEASEKETSVGQVGHKDLVNDGKES